LNAERNTLTATITKDCRNSGIDIQPCLNKSSDAGNEYVHYAAGFMTRACAIAAANARPRPLARDVPSYVFQCEAKLGLPGRIQIEEQRAFETTARIDDCKSRARGLTGEVDRTFMLFQCAGNLITYAKAAEWAANPR
jgi:hypothetical protein